MTRVVILAAGEGTRLRPHTDHLPKTLVPLLGQSLLARQMSVLARAGVSDLSLVVGYHAECLSGLGPRVFLNERYGQTNMVASLYCAKALFDGSDDVLVAYGDIVYEPRVLAAMLASRAPVSVMVDLGWWDLWSLRMDDPLADAETLKLAPSGAVVELGRKPRTLEDVEGQYTGLFRVDRAFAGDFLSRYESLMQAPSFEGQPTEKMFMTSYLQHLIDDGVTVQAVPLQHGWLEVDTVSDLARYEAAAAQGTLVRLYDGAA
ncbi:NTP transferase domain-containing protein [Piscinibacter sp. HJYY11]|uniref:phosphocholine cytidylyltransferase family protein n=1 Tax=Piscinibacter sp. HJYY11 TaxID=2801333 RepID=UPI00191E823F|nr:phosphocholine cytidylyltransferase family protein [Piscinibacter sp. HJYY11]MBL0727929.1 phosphocholine cytidylyltransferase family protein [Piscinibacter sp. HJYY11]